MTTRVQKCIEAGNLMACAALLKDWDDAELRALVQDLDAYYEAEIERQEAEYRRVAFLSELFFNKNASREIDQARERKHFDLLGMCVEISSLAMFYLGEVEGDLGSEAEVIV